MESVNASRATIVPMFSAYCDDSGTHPKSDIAIAGCYVATVDQWKEFKRNWEEVNQREDFGVFHMADFVARKKQFSLPQWQDDEKRNRTLRALIGIINCRVLVGVACAVVKSDYDEIIPDDIRQRFGPSHYSFAVRMCISLVEKWRRNYQHKEPIQYVFDGSSKGQGAIIKFFRIMESGGLNGLLRYGGYKDGWSFQNKGHVIQLQAPDIWAYENYRYAVDTYFAPKGEKSKVRESYKALLKHFNIKVRYHNRESLSKLVSKVREAQRQGKITDIRMERK